MQRQRCRKAATYGVLLLSPTLIHEGAQHRIRQKIHVLEQSVTSYHVRPHRGRDTRYHRRGTITIIVYTTAVTSKCICSPDSRVVISPPTKTWINRDGDNQGVHMQEGQEDLIQECKRNRRWLDKTQACIHAGGVGACHRLRGERKRKEHLGSI